MHHARGAPGLPYTHKPILLTMARNLANASWVVLPVGDGTSGVDGGALPPTRLNALWAAALSPEGPGEDIESFAKGLALRVGARFGASRVDRGC